MSSYLILLWQLKITGVSGYIGFKTMVLALEAGLRVRAVVRKIEQIEKLKNHLRVQQYVENLDFVVVPDLGEPHAFDRFLDGVTGILHLASPLAIETDDYDRDIVQPAINVTSSVLEAACRQPSIRRVVMTSSAVTLVPFEWLSNPDSERVYTERDLNSNPTGPFHSSIEAYWASKALSRIASQTFMDNRKPHFDLINLLPTVVIGPDELATDTASLLAGTRALAMGPILGQKIEMPLVGVQVHVDDVARAHVDALDSSIPGNTDYILTSDGRNGIEWDSMKQMVANNLPEATRVLPLNGSIPTMKWRIDASATDKAFGWKCQSFEKTMVDIVEQYLQLI